MFLPSDSRVYTYSPIKSKPFDLLHQDYPWQLQWELGPGCVLRGVSQAAVRGADPVADRGDVRREVVDPPPARTQLHCTTGQWESVWRDGEEVRRGDGELLILIYLLYFNLAVLRWMSIGYRPRLCCPAPLKFTSSQQIDGKLLAAQNRCLIVFVSNK